MLVPPVGLVVVFCPLPCPEVAPDFVAPAELCSLMLNMMVSDFAIVSGLEYIYLTFITTKSFLCGGSLENLPMSRGRTGFAAIIPIQMVSPSQE